MDCQLRLAGERAGATKTAVWEVYKFISSIVDKIVENIVNFEYTRNNKRYGLEATLNLKSSTKK